jgi:type II secretory pathway component PulJ
MSAHRIPDGARAARFTLVELMVALTILSMLMLLLAQYVVSTQRAMLMSEGMQRMYDDQRVALEIIERDLSAAVTSSLLGQEIGMYAADWTADDGDVIAMVTHGTSLEGTGPELVEVNYRVENYQLKRVEIGAGHPDWDFFGQTATTSPPWVKQTHANYETVLYDGVADFRVRLAYVVNNVAQPVAPGTAVFRLPARAEVELVLFDTMQAKRSSEARETTRRSFVRIISLNKLMQE